MTCLDCMAPGGLHDCASLLLGLFTVNFIMNPKSALHCANWKGSGYYLTMGFYQQSIRFDA